MKKKKSLLRHKSVLLVTTALLTVSGVAVAYNAATNDDTKSKPDNTNISNENATTSSVENNASDSETSRAAATKENSKPTSTTSSVNSNTNSSAAIEIKNAYQQDSGDLVVQTAITGTGSGICKLVMKKGSSSVSKSAEVLYQPTFSTCKGFVVPISEFSEGGSWSIQLTLEVNGEQKAVINKGITINK